jgi:hypothetical protein
MEVWLMRDGERFDRILGYGLIAEEPLFEQIAAGGNYFLDVTAEGPWQIDVSRIES